MDDVETRTVLTLRTGTKICVLEGLAFIVLAIYFFVVPITSVRTTTGAVFGCGTAMSPSHGSFADGVCWRIADANRYRAFAALAIALVTILAGGALFGVDRREEHRRVNRGHGGGDDGQDDDRRRDGWNPERRPVRDDVDASDERPDETEPRRRRRYDDRPDDDRDDERSSRRRDNDNYRDDDRYETRRNTPRDR